MSLPFVESSPALREKIMALVDRCNSRERVRIDALPSARSASAEGGYMRRRNLPVGFITSVGPELATACRV